MTRFQKKKATRAENKKSSDSRMLNVFRHLAKTNTYLATAGDVCGQAGCDTSLPGSARAFVTSAEEIRAWLAEDYIEKAPVGYVLSAAGRAWLKRQLAATADVFQEQHQARAEREVEVGGAKHPAIVNDAESPLAWLASRKDKNGKALLEPFQFAAGERLRADYHFAGLTARVTANWDPAAASKHSGGNSQNDMANLTDNVLAARQRVVRALAAVGPELAGILVDVCCHLKGLEVAEKTEGWPQRSGKVVLQLALSRLARHYGLITDGEGTAMLKRKLQHWGTPDYRPVIDRDGTAA